jgi:dihydrofolate synthase / folylpolyglutamate synthase
VDLGAALAYLDAHVNLERTLAPTDRAGLDERFERMQRLVALLGDPQDAAPALHLTGTNGKGSTARILSSLLAAQGLSVGTYTSPHLERVNERIAWNAAPIGDGALASAIEGVALVEAMGDDAPSYFEILTAAAFRWFAEVAVDASVIEVGMGGRWDATNVVTATVAVVTNVALDHEEYLGRSRADIAAVKAGIVEPGCSLILGEPDAQLRPMFTEAGPAEVWVAGEDFGCESSELAIGGRLLDLRTPGAMYNELYLPLHGRHQAANAACALAAAEAFFGRPLAQEVVEEAFAAVEVPGRLEVVGRRPVVLLDGAHNPHGAEALAQSLGEAFAVEGRRVWLLGMLAGRDPAEMIAALGVAPPDHVVACPPPSPRAVPAAEVAAAAKTAGATVDVAADVAEAVKQVRALATEDDQVVVTGSLYTVGAARTLLRVGAP